MSSSVSDITEMSLRFVVKWSIPIRELTDISTSKFGSIISRNIRSNLYRSKNIRGLEFSYILAYGADYTMSVENMTGLQTFLEDVLILIKDRIYRVQCNPTNTLGRLILSRSDLDRNSFKDDRVTFHCIMSIPARVDAVNIDGAPFKTTYLEDHKHTVSIVEFETLVSNIYLDPDVYDAVNDFKYSSRIPDFNVKMAVSLIGEAHKRHEPILRALCSEYLMKNLTTENVAEVLKQSIKSDAKELSEKCADFLYKKCQISLNGKHCSGHIY